jgi:3D (Asp-Asp-Asp) domain-containing protein
MRKRRIFGIVLTVSLTALLLLWNALTIRNAKELAAELAEAQAAECRTAQRLDDVETQNVVLRSVLDECVASERQLKEEVAFANKLCRLPRMTACTVSHYCCEKRPHICGTGNGITASGAPVQAGVSVAVDPKVIPLGSTVYVDYGDGVIHTYIAHDTGEAVKGNHIDVAVETHAEASSLGLRKAIVWWEEN